MLLNDQNYYKTHDIVRGQQQLFRIFHTSLGCDYILREIYSTSDEEVEMIIHNLKINQKLNHPNLVQILNFDYQFKDSEVIKENKQKEQIERHVQNEQQLQENVQNQSEDFLLDNSIKRIEILMNQLQNLEGEDDKNNKIKQQIQKKEKIWEIKIIMNNVKHTLQEELLNRQKQNYNFSFQSIQQFLKGMVNLLAGLQINKLNIRDIYPSNIFIPLIISEEASFLLGDQNESLKLIQGKKTGKYQFSKMFQNYLGYMAPEIKNAYFAMLYNSDCDQYKAGVFSLGLTLLSMATLEDQSGYNSKDEKIRKYLKNKLQIVREKYQSQEIYLILKKMLVLDYRNRMDFFQIDQCIEMKNFLEVNKDEESKTIIYLDNNQLDQLTTKQGLENLIKFTRKLTFLKCSTLESYFKKMFDSQFCSTVKELTFQFTSLKLSSIKHLFSQNLQNLQKFHLQGYSDFGIENILILCQNKMKNLIEIEISQTAINPECIYQLCQTEFIKKIKNLNLSSNQLIGDEGVQVLVTQIPDSNRIKRLHLGGMNSGCNITELGLTLIGETLKNKFCKLKYLDLSWNPLGSHSLLYIIQEKKFSHLNNLNIKQTDIDVDTFRLTAKQKQFLSNVLIDGGE